MHVTKRHKRGITLGGFLVVLALFAAAYYLIWIRPVSSQSILEEMEYTELRPPSKIARPGTWVKVRSRDPLSLDVICPPSAALGFSDSSKFLVSPSSDIKVNLSREETINFEINALENVISSSAVDAVSEVTYKLTDIELKELPDDKVLAGVKKRTSRCRNAIKFRLKNEESVTMVKSALYADAQITVKMRDKIAASVATEKIKKISRALDTKITGKSEKAYTLTGQDLIWGIRDDATLAQVGVGLPSTGGLPKERKRILGESDTITNIEVDEAQQRSLLERNEIISYDVPTMRQPGAMDCWAAVYAMMLSWKEGKYVDIYEALGKLGTPYISLFRQNAGLPGGKELEFVRAAGMVAEPPANYMISGLYEMLSENGPLWVITGDGISSHARLVVGMYGDKIEESLDVYKNTILEVVDPRYGGRSYIRAIDFMGQFEREAEYIMNRQQANQDLRWQILHW